MSDGLKTGLILGGAGLVAFLLYERSQSSTVAAGVPAVPSVPGTGSALSTAPGAAPSPSSVPSSSSGRSTLSTIGHYTAIAAIAPIVYPTKAVVVGAKAIGGALEGAFKSIF